MGRLGPKLQKRKTCCKWKSGYNQHVGLREVKKLRTRREIADRAMQLFAQRGFDHVTVAEVAAAADVSEKTVYNYFPTKEDLFFDEVPERARKLGDAIRSRPSGEPIIATLRRVQVGECRRLCTPQCTD